MSAARIRDFAVYIAVGVAFVLLIAWSVDRDIEFKWIGLVFETCLVFGCAVWDLKRYWRSLALWSALFLALVVHLAGSYLALRHVERLSAWVVSAAWIAETAVIVAMGEAVVSASFRRNRRRG